MLWTQECCRGLRRAGDLDAPLVVPSDVVGNLAFVAKNGKERQVRQVSDGRIRAALGLQGDVLRLRADGAQAFRTLTWPRG